MTKRIAIAAACVLLTVQAVRAEIKPPYWASLAAGKVRMRTGPGRNFPAVWLYQRAGLPVRVVRVFANWRKVDDPDGDSGWVQANLLSERRTAFVRGAVRVMHAAPDDASAIVWRVQPGVVGGIGQCAGGWCLLDVDGRKGFIRTRDIWGTAADERLP